MVNYLFCLFIVICLPRRPRVLADTCQWKKKKAKDLKMRCGIRTEESIKCASRFEKGIFYSVYNVEQAKNGITGEINVQYPTTEPRTAASARNVIVNPGF